MLSTLISAEHRPVRVQERTTVRASALDGNIYITPFSHGSENTEEEGIRETKSLRLARIAIRGSLYS